MSTDDTKSGDRERVLSVVEVGDLLTAQLDPVRYIVAPLMPRGVVTLLGGHGGVGKTILALTFCAHVAAGRSFAGLAVEQARVLFLSLEDAAPLVFFRLRRIIETFGLDAQAVARNLIVADGSAADPALVVEVIDMGTRRLVSTLALAELRELSAGTGLVVIDGASDAFDADENSRRQVRAFVRVLAGLARENDAAVALLAHIDKSAARFGSNGNSYSGSTAWHNSTRSRLALVEADGAIELRHEKLNAGKRAAPMAFAWTDAGVLVPADLDPADQRPAEHQDAADDAAVLDAIRAANQSNVTVPTARSGPCTALHALLTLPELPKVLRQGSGRERFWAALTRLQRVSSIVEVEFRDQHRNLRQRFCVRSLVPPYPPATNARELTRSVARVTGVSSPRTNATNATDARTLPRVCPKCGGEGCRWCAKSRMVRQ